MATYYEYTNMYLSTTPETIITYPARVSIQMIMLYFAVAADQITITDGISGMAGEATDDVVCDLYGSVDKGVIIIDWSAKPRHFFGLKTTVVDTNCKAYIYVA